ncbi:MAG: peptidylprolyl isomerase [Planctomycetota bacterium]|jgi:parvulin-like peptidyl-prolyl isomerase
MTLIVNGEKIEDSLIQQEADRLRPSYEQAFKDMGPKEREAQLLDWSRENVVERVLINQEAKKNGDRIPQEQIEAVFVELNKRYEGQQLPEELNAENEEKTKEDIELQMKVERMLQNVCKDVPKPSKEAVLKFYEENKEQLKSAEQVRVGHIVKHISWQTEEDTACDVIKKAQDELKKGAVFETLAQKYSDCPENGGDLGYITRGQMVEEFEDAVFNLNVGEVSDVFRTRFGFHIARLYDRKPPVVPGLEEVKGHILSELAEQMRGKAINDFVDRLKAKAKIEEIKQTTKSKNRKTKT